MTSEKDGLSLALVGCGKMGSALLRGWLAAGIVRHVYILDPAGLPEEFEPFSPERITFFDNPALFAAARPQASVFVMAVKPQIMDDVCSIIKKAVPADALVLSIAAGQTIAAFEKRFGSSQPIIRAMPNTPAAIGKGITVACANAKISAAQKNTALDLLKVSGKTAWIDDESLMDAVTAVSGSGPAYVFLLIEAMTDAGIRAGLPAALAATLARETVIGSAALAAIDSTTPAGTLRHNVTSPGGTTEAALNVLLKDREFHELMERAIAAATARGRELGK